MPMIVRHWLRISLRMLFVLMTAFAICLGFLSKRAHDERAAVERIRGLGGSVDYDFQYEGGETSGKRLKKPQPPGWPWLRRLIGDEYFQRVVRVDLDEMPVADADLLLIGKLPRLNVLSLNSTTISDDGLQHLGALRRLRYLGLTGAEITSNGLRVVRNFNNLDTLDLEDASGVNDDGLTHVIGLPRLNTLDLGGTAVTSAGVSQLKTLNNLSWLILGNTAVDDAAIPSLAKMPRLTELYLSDTQISGKGLIDLRDRLPSCDINCDMIHFDDTNSVENERKWKQMVERMAALNNENRLKLLDFRNTPVTDDHLPALHKLDRVEAIDLRNTKVTTPGVEQLQLALPQCIILVDAQLRTAK